MDPPSPPQHMWNKFVRVLRLNERVLSSNKAISRPNCLILFTVQVLLVRGGPLVLRGRVDLFIFFYSFFAVLRPVMEDAASRGLSAWRVAL